MAPLKPWFSFDPSKYVLHMHSFNIPVRLLLSVLRSLQLEFFFFLFFFKSLLPLSSPIGQVQVESLLPPDLNRFTDIQYSDYHMFPQKSVSSQSTGKNWPAWTLGRGILCLNPKGKVPLTSAVYLLHSTRDSWASLIESYAFYLIWSCYHLPYFLMATLYSFLPSEAKPITVTKM